ASRLAPGEKAGEAGHLPDLAEHPRGGLENGEIDVRADVENADFEGRLGFRFAQEGAHVVLVARIERAAEDPSAGRFDLRLQGLELLALAPADEDGVALGGEAARDGRADEGPGADHGGGGVAGCGRAGR